MKTYTTRLAILLAFLLIAGQLLSCDKIKNIEGTIAGTVSDSNGVGMGFLSVAVYKDGAELVRQTTNNEGGFFIGELKQGTYDIRIWNMGDTEMNITSGNNTDIKLGIGKTLTIDIIAEYPDKDK